ncbi:hypothetical protein WJX75_009351 [Coccomyxa subellipsoidea]|uniref:Uncharacterized protein n=1 Tax=Coccomyxa subellipsoidea TaxID=248742 RepID=A0ABR2YQS3_9CHLO
MEGRYPKIGVSGNPMREQCYKPGLYADMELQDALDTGWNELPTQAERNNWRHPQAAEPGEESVMNA